MNKPKGLKTKEKIMAVAAKHFFNFGLYQVTYQGIADEIGLTQPAIYKHFKSMDELFLECCKYFDEKARQKIYDEKKLPLAAHDRLKKYVEDHFEYSAKHRSHDSLVFGLYYYSMRSKPMHAYYLELKKTAIKNLSGIFEYGNTDGSWTIENPEQLAYTAHSLIVGEIFKFLIEPKEEDTKEKSVRVLAAFYKLI